MEMQTEEVVTNTENLTEDKKVDSVIETSSTDGSINTVEQPDGTNIQLQAVNNTSVPEETSNSVKDIEQVLDNPILSFDIEGALNAGYSSDEIVNYLSQFDTSFDFQGALNAGYSSDEILNFYRNLQTKKSPADIAIEDDVSDFAKGVHIAWNGIKTTAYDIGKLVGLLNKQEWIRNVQELQAETRKIEQSIKDKSLFSTATLGKLLPTIVTLPIALQSRLAILGIEGALAYSDERTTGTVEDAAIKGALAGTLAVGTVTAVDKALQVLANIPSQRTIKKVVDHYQARFKLTDDEVNKLVEKYTQVYDADKADNLTKLHAILNGTSKGFSELKEVARLNDSSAVMLSNIAKDRVNSVLTYLRKNTTGVEEANKLISDAVENVKLEYKSFIDDLNTKYGVNKLDDTTINSIRSAIPDLNVVDDKLDESLTNALSSRTGELVELLLDNNTVTPVDLVDSYKIVNEITRSVRSNVQLRKWEKLKSVLDKEIKVAIGDDYTKFKDINSAYTTMSTVMKTKIFETMAKMNPDTPNSWSITLPTLLKQMERVDSGVGTLNFSTMGKLVGSKNAAKVETAFINAIGQRADIDKIVWKTLAENANKKGFITPEGKRLQALLDDMGEVFKKDKEIQKFQASFFTSERGGLSADLMHRFSTFAVTKTFIKMLRYFSTNTRNQDRLATILRSDLAYHKLRKDFRQFSNLAHDKKQTLLRESTKTLLNIIGKPIGVTYSTVSQK